MREIKFRAWDKDEDKIVNWDFLIGYCDIDFLFGNQNIKPKRDTVPNFEIMQYTGLTDKNGVEIYEGDIVKQTFEIYRSNYYEEDFSLYGNDVGEVVLIPSKGACIKNIIRNAIENEEIETKDEKLKIYKNVVSSRCKVIGNIYENPELLKIEVPHE